MSDSNRARSGRRQVVLYLNPDEAEELARVAKKLGDSMNTIVRTALRDYMRKFVREARIAKTTEAQTEPPPHAERVKSLECSVYGGKERRSDDLVAWVRARISRDFPHATLKLKVSPNGFARVSTLMILPDGALTDGEKDEVRDYLDRAIRETFAECQALLVPPESRS